MLGISWIAHSQGDKEESVWNTEWDDEPSHPAVAFHRDESLSTRSYDTTQYAKPWSARKGIREREETGRQDYGTERGSIPSQINPGQSRATKGICVADSLEGIHVCQGAGWKRVM